MSKIKRLTFCLFFLLISGTIFSQVRDFQTWNSLSFDASIFKKTKLLFEQEFRVIDNSSYLNGSITLVGLQYKINKTIRFRGFYRYTQGFDIETGSEYNHRFVGDVVLRHQVDRFTLGYRGRYQIKFNEYQNKVIGDTPIQYFRNKLQAKYNIKKSKFNPFAAIEFYLSLNNPMGNEFDRYRVTLGTSYNFTKKFSASIFYRMQERKVSYRTPLNLTIIGTNLNYSF